MSARGIVTAEIGGKTHRFALTLGAMAEIEEATGKSFNALVAADGGLSARSALVMLTAMARAAGETAPDFSGADPEDAFAAVGAALSRNRGEDERAASDAKEESPAAEKN